MKAVVFHGIGDIRLDDVPQPSIAHPADAMVFGCGPVGQFAIASARMRGAHRVLAVDRLPDRLDMAREQGAECIDFSREDPVAVVRELTGGIGVDRVIDAVGIDATAPGGGDPDEVRQVAPETHPHRGNWEPGGSSTRCVPVCATRRRC